MFHGMNNQFEVLRSKNGTMTTVIKVTKNSITINSTTDNAIDWEITNVTSSTAETAKNQRKNGKQNGSSQLS